VALENARAYKAEQETKDYQERLISSSLDGIIAVDDHGWINVYNEGAERICGFSPEEVLNREKQVGDLYGDQGTAKYIKQTLSAEGKLENYETSMKNNNGEMIPILLSAAVLKDSKGNPIGSIGYFKDLRPLRKVEGELKSALDAISTVAKASDLDNGLAALAEKMVMGLNVSFCLMFFLDEEKQVLKVRAAYPVQRSDPLIWDPSVGNTLDLKGLPISEWLAKMESPRAFRKGENTNDENIIVDFIQETTALGNELQSALVIPFRTEQGLFGVCVLGETRNWERNPFDENKKKSAISMTDAVTVLIDRLRAQETMRRRMVLAEELRKVSDAVAHLTTEAPKAVLDQIAQSICKMVDADCVMIYPYYEDLGIYDVRNIGTYGLRDEGKRFKPKPRMRSKSMARIVLQNNMPVVVDDIDTGRDRSSHVAIWVEENEFIKRERIKSFVGIGLWGGQEVIGVLFVNFRTHHRLTDDELNTIRIFANQAAVVIQQSRLYQRGEKDHKIVLSTNKINQLIGSAEALHEVWQAILEGAMDVTSANRGRILSMDRSGNLIPEITLGFDEKSNARFQDRLYEPCPLVRGVMDNKEPLLISDMADDSHPKSLREYCTKFCPDVKSILAAPVLHNDTQTVLGILVLESADWAAFSAYDKILMAAFVKYAGIAVQSAERIAAIQQGAELRSELLKTGQGITSLEKSQEVLQSIADGAKTALGCDLVTLYTYDESREEIGYPPTISGKLMHHPALQMLGYVSKQSVVWKILQTGKPHFAEDSLHDDLVLSDASARRKDFHSFVEREEICSSAGIPLLVGDKKVGILFVNYRIPHPFPEDEQKNTLLFATQAAIAIHNARLYEDIQKHEKQLGALYDAAKVITQSAGLDRKQLLDKILELAIFITSTRGEKAALGTIQIIDEQTNAREFTNVYPPSEYSKLRVKLGHRLSLDKTKTKDGRIGIPGRAAVTMKPQLVSNIKNDPDYIEYSPDTKSELAVPLLDGDRTIGIFSVESDMISAFDASDQEALEALAELAVIAIKNAEQYEVLRKTQDELLAAGTIAWMGLFGSDWSHTVAQKTYSIRTYANTIKDMLQTGDSATKQALEQIDRIAQEIQDVPLVLSSPAQIEQGSPLLIDSFILDETKRLIQSHSQIQQKFGLGCNKITVRADKTLLKMALQKLVENAVRNMSDHGILIVESQVVDKGTVSVTIQDTGHGMPEEVKLIYGLKRIPKGPGERGSGMGALLARFILRKYGGDLRLIWSEKDRGTKVEVTLPICVQLDRVERKDL
jgi:PAS domain S-box-containing protein